MECYRMKCLAIARFLNEFLAFFVYLFVQVFVHVDLSYNIIMTGIAAALFFIGVKFDITFAYNFEDFLYFFLGSIGAYTPDAANSWCMCGGCRVTVGA